MTQRSKAMNNQQTTRKITLEDIARRKEEVLIEIRVQKEAMTATAKEIIAPLAPAASAGNTLMRSFNTGMAIFDGVMMGIKIMRKVRSMFRK